MRTLSICVVASSAILLVITACGPKNTQQPGTTPTATAYPGGYPPPQGQYPQGGAYPPATAAPTYAAPGQPMPGPTGPTGPAPTSGAPMATPGPLAFTCQNDVPCGTHHCNTQYGKCAFPCQSASDCITPNQCLAGFCVPIPAAAH